MIKKRIGIVGATGFTGSELVRLLINHPEVEITAITSESRKGEEFSDVHPQFLGLINNKLISINDLPKDLDIVFLALPHGVSMDFVKAHHENYRIIDLSGDFRLSGKNIYEFWYKKDHVYADGFANAVYGLPELYRTSIKDAKLVANPGCFPTSAILALAPLFANQLVSKDHIIVDSKTGVTGAGIKVRPNTHFSVVNDNFTAYGIKTHRHSIEIQEKLEEQQKGNLSVLFTPHLLPVDRGILSTCYTKPKEKVGDKTLNSMYSAFYKDEPFIRLRKSLPNLKEVRGSNFADIFVTYDERTDTIISVATIDNLVKGAAGQAIHNMNIMLGFDEKIGLNQIPLQP
ncbi:MAG: N-acetyl-gamma-glutamyl-phosphate reductase [Cytophagales bacterium]